MTVLLLKFYLVIILLLEYYLMMILKLNLSNEICRMLAMAINLKSHFS